MIAQHRRHLQEIILLEEPRNESRQLFRLKNGEVVVVEDLVIPDSQPYHAGFYKIRSKGRVGWARTIDLRKPMKEVTTRQCEGYPDVALKRMPHSAEELVARLPNGTQVTLLSFHGDYAKVQYGTDLETTAFARRSNLYPLVCDMCLGAGCPWCAEETRQPEKPVHIVEAPKAPRNVTDDRKSLENSQFKCFYNPKERITNAAEVMATVRSFLIAYASLSGGTQERALEMSAALDADVGRIDELDELTSKLTASQNAAVKIWTSIATVEGKGFDKEFCSILNDVLRRDEPGEALSNACKLCSALNSLLVTRFLPSREMLEWPPVVYRGCCMPIEKLSFFEIGKLYRVPTLLSTTAKHDTAYTFLRKGKTEHAPVMFTLNLPSLGCMHALCIEDYTLISGEQEYLFVAYSAFRVKSVRKTKDPNWADPIIIELEVQYDNRDVDEDVELADWH